MRKIIAGALSLLVFLSVFSAKAEIGPDIYWVQFKDKLFNTHSITDPSTFLSARAVSRRTAQGIAVTENDLPVTATYLAGVKAVGVEIIRSSRWLNGVIIRTTDPGKVTTIQGLPYVKFTKALPQSGKSNQFQQSTEQNYGAYKLESLFAPAETNSATELDYGSGYNQINILRGEMLHLNNFRGQGMLIGVLDAGFQDANAMPGFSHLFSGGKIKATYDLVDKETDVYDDHFHGMMVLSCMGANLAGQLVGTAPQADYILLRTEDADTEYIWEEYLWVCGAEFADSAGVDIINSSLGYTTFDDATTNHTHSQLDGKTAIITLGADMAASKGILVVNSAGNSGSSSWGKIAVPADGDSVLAVGAVNSAGNYAAFSSRGPSADGRIKPNVAGLGQGTTVFSLGGGIQSGNGTSFSAPTIAGMAACLWQANPSLKMTELKNYIERSASQYTSPDQYLGYGIPNFSYAWYLITGLPSDIRVKEGVVTSFPNPFEDNIQIVYMPQDTQTTTITLSDMAGRIHFTGTGFAAANNYNRFKLDNLGVLPAGVYFVRLSGEKESRVLKFIKN